VLDYNQRVEIKLFRENPEVEVEELLLSQFYKLQHFVQLVVDDVHALVANYPVNNNCCCYVL